MPDPTGEEQLPDNDPDIPDDEVLYRRVPEWQIVDSEEASGKRLAGNAFLDPDPMGVSVFLRSELLRLRLGPRDVLQGSPSTWGVAAITAGRARSEGFGVRKREDPTAPLHSCNPAHGELTGLRPGNQGKSQAKRLARPPTELLLFSEEDATG